MSRSPITCHVLDASLGRPAAGVEVQLHCLSIDHVDPSQSTSFDLPQKLAEGRTNEDGRCTDLIDPSTKLSPGAYKMTFRTGAYFSALNIPAFYPLVEITFTYSNPNQHYHIPLLLSPFSYTTYRGS